MPRRIVIVDDELNIGRSLELILSREGWQVELRHSAADFQNHLDAAAPADIYFFDVRLPDGNGIALLEKLRATECAAPAIMISGHGTIADAVAAVHAGAFDFLEKPLSRDRVLLAVARAAEQAKLRAENARLREELGTGSMIGQSAVFRAAVEQATLAARSDARVLLIGESGTGKELLAAHIHAESRVAAGPFVKVNCAAIPTELMESELFGHERGSFTGATAQRRGKFELADGGTLLLDEIGDLAPHAQAKLLRVLQEGEFHRVGGERPLRVAVRVVSATNRDLQELVRKEQFREDLFYRVAAVPVRLPPLRERPEDIAPLARHFLEEFCRRNQTRSKRLDDAALSCLAAYPWPGNIRELRNVVERMAILSPGELISEAAVPHEIRRGPGPGPRSSLAEARETAEREEIYKALDAAAWNVSRAARTLGLERTNLHKRMRALGIQRG
jgi:two-component system nitrogen regulation response regulator NtrX